MKYSLLIFLFILPFTTFARSYDRDDLDDDVVEEFAVPVLFGVDIDDVRPDFGDSRGGGTRSHEGQDFLAPQGTPIVSPTEAVVIRTGAWASAGKHVYTANPGGETFAYLHLDEIADIDVGDKLDVGDYIGTVGDTGNAVPGQYHLHFETIDDHGDAKDPYSRMTEEFDLEDKMDFLNDVFKKRRDDSEYAEFLVETFPSVFRQAVADDVDMPRAIDRAIDDAGFADEIEQVEGLLKLIETIPALLTSDLQTGDSDVRVSLLQIYIMYSHDGPARDRLAAAGPTGYYGSITAAAVAELQDEEGIDVTGVYDSETRSELRKRKLARLTF